MATEESTTATGRSALGAVGSLWFAAVVLMSLLVAMACATVYESMHGSEQALVTFYRSWWFELLLALLAVNVIASAALRFPFTRQHIGFLVTHMSIVLTLGGALASRHFGIEGRMGLAEGETLKEFVIPEATLSVLKRGGTSRTSIDLTSRGFKGFKVVEQPDADALVLGDLRVEVERYFPDCIRRREIVDDNPMPHYAIEMSMSPTGIGNPSWVFADDHGHGTDHAASLTYRVAKNAEEFDQLIAEKPARTDTPKSMIRIERAGSVVDIPLDECLKGPVPVAGTEYTLRAVRYLPHAIVGQNNKLTNASDRPVNPAVEVELAEPSGKKETRFAFAKFPDFQSMHGTPLDESLKVIFLAAGAASESQTQVVLGPDGRLFARFESQDGQVVAREVTLSEPLDYPWSPQKLTVLRRFDHARIQWLYEPVIPVRAERQPAIRLKMTSGDTSEEVWLMKYYSRRMAIGGASYEFSFGEKAVPLGFSLTLNSFRLGLYPGSSRHRSYESNVTIVDPTGLEQTRVISMNNPAKHGGYTLYQHRYRIDGGKKSTVLNVARDPGLPIVFAGYIGTITGMIILLCTRIAEHRRASQVAARRAERFGDGAQQADEFPPRFVEDRSESPLTHEAQKTS